MEATTVHPRLNLGEKYILLSLSRALAHSPSPTHSLSLSLAFYSSLSHVTNFQFMCNVLNQSNFSLYAF